MAIGPSWIQSSHFVKCNLMLCWIEELIIPRFKIFITIIVLEKDNNFDDNISPLTAFVGPFSSDCYVFIFAPGFLLPLIFFFLTDSSYSQWNLLKKKVR